MRSWQRSPNSGDAQKSRSAGERFTRCTAIETVSQPALLQTAVTELERQLGPVDLLIANAGIGFETSALRLNPEDVAKITRAVNRVFSFQPADIIDQLNLRRPIFSKTTNYGHFGKSDKDLTWEATNKVQALKKALSSSTRAA